MDDRARMLTLKAVTKISRRYYVLMVSVSTAEADFMVEMKICAKLSNFLVSGYL